MACRPWSSFFLHGQLTILKQFRFSKNLEEHAKKTRAKRRVGSNEASSIFTFSEFCVWTPPHHTHSVDVCVFVDDSRQLINTSVCVCVCVWTILDNRCVCVWTEVDKRTYSSAPLVSPLLYRENKRRLGTVGTAIRDSFLSSTQCVEDATIQTLSFALRVVSRG